MGFCSCTVKFMLFVLNLACAILGLVIVVVSVLANMNGKSFKVFLQGEISTTSIVLIVVGSLVFLIAFFGCCGVIREDNCMITTYAVLLSALLLIQIAIGVMAFLYRNKFENEFKKFMEKEYENYEQNKKVLDVLQSEIQCCGLEGAAQWTQPTFPASCCPQTSDSKGNTCQRGDAYTAGCLEKSTTLIKSELKMVGLVALIIAAVEFFCVVCAFCLASSIRRESMRGYA